MKTTSEPQAVNLENFHHVDEETYFDGRDGERLLQKCCVDLGIREETAIEFMGWAEEHYGSGGVKLSADTKRARKWVARLLLILRYLKSHSSQTELYAALHVFNERELDMLNSNMTMTQFAKTIGVTKAAVNKAVQEAQKFFKTEPRAEQRNQSACEAMSARRIDQLKQ